VTSVAEVAHAVRLSARALADVEGYADLVSAVGDRRLVLLGEATHGTHEFLARKQRQPRSKALHLY